MTTSSDRSGRRPATALVSLGLGLAATSALRGDWPTDPGFPLALGPADASVHPVPRVTGAVTWVSWIDDICFGGQRLQRIDARGELLAPDGMLLSHVVEFCASADTHLATMSDGSVVAFNPGGTVANPVHRVAADGTRMWGDGIEITEWTGGLGAVLGLEGGDTLLAGHAGFAVFVTRRALDGSAVWTTEIPVASSSNKRLLGLVPDGAGGAYLAWDRPLTYTRMIEALHIDGAGESQWADPVVVVPPDPSSSRHSDPVFLADGTGGAVVVFVLGRETAGTPAPVLMQRIDPRGTVFPPEGVRVSVTDDRQYDPVVDRDAATNDLIVTWRNGPYDGQELRAQRLTLDGTRTWGDTGVGIVDVGTLAGHWFDAAWNGDVLAAAVCRVASGVPTVQVTRADGNGDVFPGAMPVSGSIDAMTVRVAPVEHGFTISYLDVAAQRLVAQRLHSDGTLGLRPGDLDGDGVVDTADLITLLGAWGPCRGTCPGDLDGDGSVGVSDLLALLTNWS